MTVPRKPPTMSGPCIMGSVGISTGQAQPMRSSPAHMPASKASMASGSSQTGAGTDRSES